MEFGLGVHGQVGLAFDRHFVIVDPVSVFTDGF